MMRNNQTKAVIILSAVLLLLVLVYIFVSIPMKNEMNKTPDVTAAVPETEDGEAVGLANKILVYPQVSTDDIQSIIVINEYGRYKIYRNTETDSPEIEGFEGVAFHEQNMSSLMTSCGYPLAITKVGKTEDLSEYGLDKTLDENGNVVEQPPRFVMKTKDGVEYKCYIGDKITTGTGYYFLYEGRPDTVYVLDTSIAETLLAPVEVLVEPMIITPMTQNDYFMVHDFILRRYDQTIICFDYIEEADRKGTEFETSTYRMLYPQNITPSAEAISSAMKQIYQAGGDEQAETKLEVVCLGVTDETLAKYNIGDDAYVVQYDYWERDLSTAGSPVTVRENMILISPRNPDGSYYVASPYFQQIVKAEAEACDFLTWDLFDWVEAPFFQMKIGYVTDISVSDGRGFEVDYKLEGEGQELVVTEVNTGYKPDVNNFRQFYKTLLYSSYEGDCSLESSEKEALKALDDSEAQVVFTVKTDAGRVLTYKFYQYSERRSYVTLNGEGEFYCLKTVAEKILADAKRVQSGEPITSTDKY